MFLFKPVYWLHSTKTFIKVFTGQIFSPYSNPPRKVESKSIPPQIQKLVGHPSHCIPKKKNCFLLYRVKISAVLVCDASNLAHFSITAEFLGYNLASVLLTPWSMNVGIYRFVLSWWPSSKYKPIHLSQIITNCAPFPSIFTPYPFPYGFSLHWGALTMTILIICDSWRFLALNSLYFVELKISRLIQ